jgi:hypothetical protein
MADLTLADINNYLNGVNGVSKIEAGQACGIIGDVDAFLLTQAGNVTRYNTSSITKDNFLELYNEQYARNAETFVGIIIVSAILAKMMFYPTKL